MADQEDIPKQWQNLCLHRGHKRGNGDVIGLLAASQGDEDHVFPASLLDLPGGDEPPGIAQQDDFQEVSLSDFPRAWT